MTGERAAQARIDVLHETGVHRAVGGGGAVVFVGDEDHGQMRVRPQEALVVGNEAGKRHAHRLQLVLEPAARRTEHREAREHLRDVAGEVGDRPASLGNQIPSGVRVESTTLSHLQDAAVTDRGPARSTDGRVARAEVGRHHAQVQIRKAGGHGLERLDEAREVAREVGLFLGHGGGVVDHEEQVELDGATSRDHPRALPGRARGGHRRHGRVARTPPRPVAVRHRGRSSSPPCPRNPGRRPETKPAPRSD